MMDYATQRSQTSVVKALLNEPTEVPAVATSSKKKKQQLDIEHFRASFN